MEFYRNIWDPNDNNFYYKVNKSSLRDDKFFN